MDPDVERDDGTPVYPRESAAQKRSAYSLLCISLIDDWCRGSKSKVEGKGLWSINPRYSWKFQRPMANGLVLIADNRDK
ncbi:hypothetical protein IW146_004396 [Coemansia sp. RSA 922]|nr:hypothetical protein IW146_004396 [Coemansia sp. RSA 922]